MRRKRSGEQKGSLVDYYESMRHALLRLAEARRARAQIVTKKKSP